MKISLLAFLAASLFSTAFAGVETWTNKSGKSAQLELVSVEEVYGRLVGEFKMADGRMVKIGAIDLIDADAKRLVEAHKKPSASASVFDVWTTEGNLVELNGKSLKRLDAFEKPTKYYLFYYTASWCGPCHKFTPSLVEFYKAKKNPEFEVILITSDSDEKAMEEYAAEMQMPWPQLKLSKVEKFDKEFNHPGTGIPNLVLTDLQGNLIKTSYVDGKYVGPTSVMNHLGTLLNK